MKQEIVDTLTASEMCVHMMVGEGELEGQEKRVKKYRPL